MLAQAAGRQSAVPHAPAIAPPPVPPPLAPPFERFAEPAPARALAPRPKSSWFRPLELMIAVGVLALAAIMAWGVMKDRFQTSAKPETAEEVLEEESTSGDPPVPLVPATPIVLLQEGSGEVNLSPATATLSGNAKLRSARGEQVLANWFSTEDSAEWRFRLIIPGPYRVVFTYAATESVLGAGLEVTLDEDRAGCDLRPTGSLNRFDAASLSVLIPESGEHTLSIRPKHASQDEWLHIKGVQLVPVNPPKLPETVRPPTAAQSDL
jgi:hypothetical protein